MSNQVPDLGCRRLEIRRKGVIPSYPDVLGRINLGMILPGLVPYFTDGGVLDSASRRLEVWNLALTLSSSDVLNSGVQKIGDPGEGGRSQLIQNTQIKFCIPSLISSFQMLLRRIQRPGFHPIFQTV